MTSPHEGHDPAEAPPVLAPGHDVITRVMSLSAHVAELQERLRRLESSDEQLRGLLDQFEQAARLEETAPGQAPDPTEEAGDAEATRDRPEPLDLRHLVAWVRENLSLVIERKIPTSRSPYWCPWWWQHPEAIARLEAAHRSWLEATVSPGNALAVYFEHLDHQLNVLMSEGGPFSACSIERHSPVTTRLLGQHEPPDEYFASYETFQPHSVSTADTTAEMTAAPTAPVYAASGHGGPRIDTTTTLPRGRAR